MSKPMPVTCRSSCCCSTCGRSGGPASGGPRPTVPISRLVVEKIPGSPVDRREPRDVPGAVPRRRGPQSVETVPIGARLANATVSRASYIFMTVSRQSGSRRSVLTARLQDGGCWCCLLILSGVSAVAFRIFQRRPYFLVGWLWYFVTLLPVPRTRDRSAASRWPTVFMVLAARGSPGIVRVWGAGDRSTSLRVPRLAVVGAAALAMVAAFGGAARVQAGYWKDSETLWRRARTSSRTTTWRTRISGSFSPTPEDSTRR